MLFTRLVVPRIFSRIHPGVIQPRREGPCQTRHSARISPRTESFHFSFSTCQRCWSCNQCICHSNNQSIVISIGYAHEVHYDTRIERTRAIIGCSNPSTVTLSPALHRHSSVCKRSERVMFVDWFCRYRHSLHLSRIDQRRTRY
jgi:hypothetical protein